MSRASSTEAPMVWAFIVTLVLAVLSFFAIDAGATTLLSAFAELAGADAVPKWRAFDLSSS